MEMAKRLRQKLHSFCSLRTEVFSARGISDLFKNQSSTRKFVAFYTLFVSASMVPFPRRGHEKLPYISPNFSPAAKNLAPSRAEHGNGGRKIGIPVEDSKNCENHLSSHAKIFKAKRYL